MPDAEVQHRRIAHVEFSGPMATKVILNDGSELDGLIRVDVIGREWDLPYFKIEGYIQGKPEPQGGCDD
ncbi:MAG: hypothetical protein P4L11_13550 [Geothrix sp.]|nr:hypothetical protein [Geothrix sp.]